MSDLDQSLLREEPFTGFFEELDKTSIPWRGLARFRFQAQDRRAISERLFTRDEIDAITSAAYELPQDVRIEGDPRRWWLYEGNWYRTRADLHPGDVASWVHERYREYLAKWGWSASAHPELVQALPDEDRPRPYLSVCSMFLNGAPFLAEWLEFHILAGVERFFLYDHESTDDSRDVLAPYVEDGIVVVRDWPVYPGQHEAFQDCAERHRADSRWIAFIDLDEFLFSPTGRPLPEVLRAFEPWPGVLVNRPVFGSSGHEVQPSGLVTENYVLRCNSTTRNRAGKTIADPRRLARCCGGHHWTYTDGYAIDVRLRPAPVAWTLSLSFSLLRLNHYTTRSREEFESKLATPRADLGTLRTGTTFEKNDRNLNDITDLAAASHAPALEDALRRRQKIPIARSSLTSRQ